MILNQILSEKPCTWIPDDTHRPAASGGIVLHRDVGAALASGVSTREAVSSSSSCASPVGAHELTAVDLEAFLDGLMPAQLEREDIAGAVIAVVKDGQVIFAKGHGYSDMSKRTPVPPDSTMARRRYQHPTPKRRGAWWTLRFRQDEIVNGKLTREVITEVKTESHRASAGTIALELASIGSFR
jgi:hypothetical protein